MLSSHLLPDVESTCDHVVVLDKGRVVTAGPIAALKGPGGRVYEVRVKGDVEAFAASLRGDGIECHPGDGDFLRVFLPDGSDPQRLFALAVGARVQVRHLQPSQPSLGDVFARVVGEE